MRRSSVIAILLFLLPFLPAFGNECSDFLHHILRSESFQDHRQFRLSGNELGLRSEWGRGAEVRGFNQRYRKMKFEHPWEPFVPVGVGSIGEKDPELVFFLDDICHYQMDLYRFEEEFREAFCKAPEAEDYRDFYRTRFSILMDGLTHWFSELKKVIPEGAVEIEKNYSKRVLTLEQRIANLDQEVGTDALKRTLEGINSMTLGMLGELYGISSIPKVKTASTYLSQMPELMAALKEKMHSVQLKIAEDPSHLGLLEEEYPNVFKSSALRNFVEKNPGVGVDKRLDFILKWISGKEIDFVRANGAKETWLELKTKRHPMTMAEFTRESKGFKSPERQILEDREILQFVGFEDRVDLEYYVTSGMELDLKKTLEFLGVKPVEFKYKVRH